MKKYLILGFVFSAGIALGQNNPIGYSISQTKPLTTDEVVNQATFTEDGIEKKAFRIVYDGSITTLVNKLKIGLGNEDVKSDAVTHKVIYFKKFKRPEWSDQKITLRFESLSNGNRHLISIVCTDSEGVDLLEFGSESQQKIKRYLESLLVK
ncbi:hypothetical protein [Flavobacterium sp.]|uniref:hypothetical protein n=1 Tax=Flavobacterium sp. TaxID=239 RepID=UPI0039E69E06